jgi:hypothetical protein
VIRFLRRSTVYCLLMAGGAAPAAAQVDGSVSVMADAFPDLGESAGRQAAGELRTRVQAERRQDLGSHLRLVLSGQIDALIREGGGSSAHDAIIRPRELYIEAHGDRFDLRAGASRLVWGRLDEFQPTDVVNPIDLSRFLLEGRSEARMAVGMVRGRVFLPGATVLEGVMVPVFRPGRFDQLDEDTSPFTLVPFRAPEPSGVQGGARLTSTIDRVDVGVTAYRGFRPFGFYERFTMVGGDFETVRGPWGLRGEAAFSDDGETAFDGGMGVDRRAGGYRIAANVLYSHRLDHDVSLVAVADRSFARETRTVRMFAVYNPGDGTTFARTIASASLRDNVTIEGSAGVFAGRSTDTLGLLTKRDFVYARLQVFF